MAILWSMSCEFFLLLSQTIVKTIVFIVSAQASYAANIVVTSNLDNGVSCTLRDAITSINNGSVFMGDCVDATSDGLGVEDKITFDLGTDQRVIFIENSELNITKGVRITGSEVGGVEISARGSRFRVINIAADTAVTLDQISVSNGEGGDGGCINISSGASLAFLNGAIERCVALGGADGGGVNVTGGTLVLENSLVRDNVSLSGGGGISALNGSTLEIINSTISGNEATDANVGGGVLVGNSNATFSNVTIANNITFMDSPFGPEPGGDGGGLAAFGATTVRLVNSIIANSVEASDCLAIAPATIVSDSSSIIESGSCSGDANLARSVNPRLRSLRSLDGKLATHLPVRSSPAVNSGDNATCEEKDQNGSDRPRTDENPCDVGAVELEFDSSPDLFIVIPAENGNKAVIAL